VRLGILPVLQQPVGLAGIVLGVAVCGKGCGGFVEEGLGVREDSAGGDAECHGLEAEKVEGEFVGDGAGGGHGGRGGKMREG